MTEFAKKMQEFIPAQYLGDGVYASWDGYQIWLSTEGVGHNSQIAIDPAVSIAFANYIHAVTDYLTKDLPDV